MEFEKQPRRFLYRIARRVDDDDWPWKGWSRCRMDFDPPAGLLLCFRDWRANLVAQHLQSFILLDPYPHLFQPQSVERRPFIPPNSVIRARPPYAPAMVVASIDGHPVQARRKPPILALPHTTTLPFMDELRSIVEMGPASSTFAASPHVTTIHVSSANSSSPQPCPSPSRIPPTHSKHRSDARANGPRTFGLGGHSERALRVLLEPRNASMLRFSFCGLEDAEGGRHVFGLLGRVAEVGRACTDGGAIAQGSSPTTTPSFSAAAVASIQVFETTKYSACVRPKPHPRDARRRYQRVDLLVAVPSTTPAVPAQNHPPALTSSTTFPASTAISPMGLPADYHSRRGRIRPSDLARHRYRRTVELEKHDRRVLYHLLRVFVDMDGLCNWSQKPPRCIIDDISADDCLVAPTSTSYSMYRNANTLLRLAVSIADSPALPVGIGPALSTFGVFFAAHDWVCFASTSPRPLLTRSSSFFWGCLDLRMRIGQPLVVAAAIGGFLLGSDVLRNVLREFRLHTASKTACVEAMGVNRQRWPLWEEARNDVDTDLRLLASASFLAFLRILADCCASAATLPFAPRASCISFISCCLLLAYRALTCLQIVVGASVAGLAVGVALRKAGHDVQVLDKADKLPLRGSSVRLPTHFCLCSLSLLVFAGSRRLRSVCLEVTAGIPRPRISSQTPLTQTARMPPNGSKILFDWGLHTQSQFMDYNPSVGAAFFTGFRFEGKGSNGLMDLMGYQSYSREMLEQVRGDFLILRYADLINVLYQLIHHIPSQCPSRMLTSPICFNAEVSSVDLDACSVRLKNGETLYADAIIGADGLDGAVRAALRQEAASDLRPSKIWDLDYWVYSGMIPPEDVERIEPSLLKPYVGHGQGIFFGHNRTALLLGMGNQLSLCIIVIEGGHKTISDSLGPDCDGFLRQLAAYADANTECPIVIRRTCDPGQLDSWVSHSGRVAVLGEAAHPFTPVALQSYACALEDGAFLGKIFSHTDDPKRVPELLHAFQEHRQPRTDFLRTIEEKYLVVLTVPNGEQQEMRDGMFRSNHALGRNILDAPEATKMEVEAMEETQIVFDYDPEDDADEWWITWGRYHDTGSGPGVRKDLTRDLGLWFSESAFTQISVSDG
uniref:FAD/NAD(P)-binding domain-containing protein n=1 Tax=Mycena chlorophos TaxID=658473 RepID=A0ABQ0KUV2_MYCCL|nr:predicted protein [Mycena chlorophos]